METINFRKKSQISIFIIIGIILVIVTSFLIYNSEFEIFVSHDTKLKNQISQVVKDCIYDSADTGTFLLGWQGGYIEIPSQIKNNPTKYIDFGLKMPNWDSSKRDIPTIPFMERELKNYVEKTSLACIQTNLKAMENAFEIKLDGEFNIIPTINDNSVTIEASYPITFNEKNSNEILTVEDYVVNLENLRLGDLYKLAVEIYNTEARTNIFEELTIDQIHTANDYSSKLSMPTEGMVLSCGKRVWTYPQLKENLANMNNNNFKYLQFEGTYSKEEVMSLNLDLNEHTKSLKEYFLKLYNVPLNNPKPSFKNYDVKVFMPSTEINNNQGLLQKYPFRTFEVSPSNGQVTQSMDMELDLGAKIPIPCMQIFHHLYTLDYDLVVQLEDKTPEGNFIFQFPVRVEIYNNQAKEKPVSLITTQESNTFTNENYCNEENYKYPLMVMTTDKDENPITGVDISYKCINIECEMGTTEKPTFMGQTRKYATPELTTEYPYCIGGKIIGEKEGYHTEKVRVNTDETLLRRESFIGDNLVELKMTALKTFDIDSPENFLIIQKEDGRGKRVLTEEDGMILIEIENEEKDFESTAVWPNEGEILNKLNFLDEEGVKYNLTGYYMDANNNLKGMLEIQNWVPDIHAGNNIQFVIPGSANEIDEDAYVEFYEYALSKSSENTPRIY